CDRYVRCLAIDRVTPNTVYAGGYGIWKSTDGGVSWLPLYSLPEPVVGAIAIDTVTPRTLYAGTNSGVFKSTDGGVSWMAVNGGLTSNNVIHCLAIDPATPTT